MNTSLHSSYTAHQRNYETTREGEARALLSCAAKLEEARHPDATREEFGLAIRHNQKLWTLFQVGLCDPENPLPRDLKTLLLNLSIYIDKVSFRALGSHDKDLVLSLISINRTIAKGLSVNNEARAPQQQSVPMDSAPTTAPSLSTSA